MIEPASPSIEPEGHSGGQVADSDLDLGVKDNGSVDGGGVIRQLESSWLIQVGHETLTLPSDASPELISDRFAELCKTVPGADKRCVLALSSDECFCVDFDRPESIDLRDRAAIKFELERHFPLDAESMVSDYSVRGSSKRISAVAIETDRHRALVTVLENAGIEIVSIVPFSLLVARAALLRLDNRLDNGASFELFLVDHDLAESLRVDEDGVFQWRRFYDADELRRRYAITADPNDRSQNLVVGQKRLPFKPHGPVQWCDRSADQLAIEGAALVLAGRWGRWPNFRVDDLAPADPLYAVAKPLRLLAVAATVCFLVVACAAWYRSERIAKESEAIREAQRSLFRATFPGRRVPVMLLRSVRNEHGKTLGSRGRGDSIKLPMPATTVLGELFRGLAHARSVGDARFRLLDVDIVDGDCSLTVRAVDAIQIGTIAKSLETVGFAVSPPASEQIDPSKDEPIPTYQSTISAVWSTPTAVAKNGDDS